jgi:hypothetical protein
MRPALPDGQLWVHEGEVDVLPSLVGDVVGFTGNGKVTVLNARTGKQRSRSTLKAASGGHGLRRKIRRPLLVDADDARPDQLIVVNEHGQIRHTATTIDRVGTPAALGGIGFVPWIISM